VVALAASLSACATNGSDPAAPRRPGGAAGRTTASGSAASRPSTADASSVPASAPASVAPAASIPADVLARLPRFGPTPVPTPVGPVAPSLSRVPTDQPVAFLTIDDGWIRRPEAITLLMAAGVPVSQFLTVDAVRADPDYFRRLQGAGAVVEAHTITHVRLRGLPYHAQRREICGSADRLGALFGRRPRLFRAPYGETDATTLRAVRDCGLRAAVGWTATVDHGVVRYQRAGELRPGDVVLMHFRQGFVEDFIAALVAIKTAGLTPGVLDGYLADG
jgi:peptidoglycan/xylan/chitin deacetylase (PgdA/CDA1 family)